MIGWFMVLSFVLGFALTWLYVARSVTRTVDPVGVQHRFGSHGDDDAPARPRRGRSGDTEEIVVIDPEDAPEPEPERHGSSRRRSTVVPQVVEFEDDTEEFYER
ncbi:channel accessory protein ArfC [Mobilicoccus pelagius]|uniref:Uncharacterized protein n=1 Tax=Mobilicoccus pelagius NBRC 104925 TaxID=1089455 RepID=H5USM9_9MICO|nr:hypothetical protein [Mobilicoccus pelagius]GAB48737.1 hypothetical protein MOPEL_080_00160 [Mobilicoccus pelagius NBRC 104925]